MKRWIRWAVVALVVIGLALAIGRALQARKAQQAALAEATAARATTPVVELAPADVLRAVSGELVRVLPVSGTVRAVNSAVVKARVAGELLGLKVREGDQVRAGELLGRIDETEYRARVQQAQQQADAARAQIDIAQRQYDNNRALVDQGFISRTALDTSQASLAAARASHEAALAAVDLARKGLADTALVAPLGGQVSQRLAQPGERVPVDGRVLEIVDLSRLEIEVPLSPADAAALRVGQTATLQVEGLSAPVQAQVVRLNPTVQAGSRSVLAYLALAPAPGLRHGLYAQGSIALARLTALGLPVEAVRTDKPAPYVQVVEGGHIVHRPVSPGVRAQAGEETRLVVTGLPEGALVVAGQVGVLRPGTAIRLAGPSGPASAPASAPSVQPAR